MQDFYHQQYGGDRRLALFVDRGAFSLTWCGGLGFLGVGFKVQGVGSGFKV